MMYPVFWVFYIEWYFSNNNYLYRLYYTYIWRFIFDNPYLNPGMDCVFTGETYSIINEINICIAKNMLDSPESNMKTELSLHMFIK